METEPAPAFFLALRHTKQAGGKGETEKGKQPAAQKKRARTVPRQVMQKQPLLLAVDAFVAALGAVPAEDWCRTWAAGRTIMLRRTSKRVKEVVDKMRLPAVVRLSRSFWDDARNGTAAEKLKFVMSQLVVGRAPHHHTRAAALWNEKTRCREACRSAGAVPSAGAP